MHDGVKKIALFYGGGDMTILQNVKYLLIKTMHLKHLNNQPGLLKDN